MKQITLLVASLMLTFASISAQQAEKPNAMKGSMRQAVQAQKNMSRMAPAAKLQAAKAPAGMIAEDPIIEMPAGDVYEVIQSYSGLQYSRFFGWSVISTSSGKMTIVEGTDGNIYLKGLCPRAGLDEYYWVKATKGEGDNIIIEKQPLGFYEDYYGEKQEYYISAINYSYNEESGEENITVPEDGAITLKYKDGIISSPDEMMSEGEYIPGTMFGPIYWYEAAEDDEYESGWYHNNEFYWNFSTEILTETYVEPNDYANVEDMVLKYKNNEEGMVKQIKVAFEGDNVYLYLYENVLGWIKGTIEGDKITVPNGQFLGFDSSYQTYEWAHTASVEFVTGDDEFGEYAYDYGTIIDNIVFDYDADTKTMTATDAIYFDAERDRIYYVDHIVEPMIYKFEEVAATPADPIIDYFWDYDDYYGNAELDFTINAVDVDGNYINPDKVSYKIYVDDELFEATSDDYEGMEESMTEFPYGFMSASGYIGSTFFCVMFQPAKNVGIQTIYRGAGEERHSNIVLYNIATGEKETVAENMLGINSANNATLKVVGTYDLQGRRVSNNAKGIVIKRMANADGTVKTMKVVR